MPFTYSGEPGSSLRDQVRFLIQDTDSKSPLLQDAEVEWAIGEETSGVSPTQGEMFSAAALCLETLSHRFAAQADTEFGSLRITYSKAAEGYAKRAERLRARAVGAHAPWAGGQSKSEKEARAQETDRVQPAFVRDQFKTPYTGPFNGTGVGNVEPGESERRA